MAQAKILIADNDPDFLETRREFLEKEGYVVVTASSPTEAQKKLQQESGVDLAIVDVRLLNDDDEKDISGLEFAKSVGGTVPVIVLTGYRSVEYMQQALRLQTNGTRIAQDFIAKQDGPMALLSAIRRALEVASGPKTTVGDTVGNEDQVTRFKQWNPLIAMVALLLALGSGVAAIIYSDPRWLIGTVFLAILVVLLIGLGEIRENRLSPNQKPSREYDPVTLDVPEQMRQDYELARQHARWIGGARIGLTVGGALIFLVGIVTVVLGYRDVGIIGTIGGLIAGTLGRLMDKPAEDANRRWDQFHKESVLLYKRQSSRGR